MMRETRHTCCTREKDDIETRLDKGSYFLQIFGATSSEPLSHLSMSFPDYNQTWPLSCPTKRAISFTRLIAVLPNAAIAGPMLMNRPAMARAIPAVYCTTAVVESLTFKRTVVKTRTSHMTPRYRL
jgi:hypothetical protein